MAVDRGLASDLADRLAGTYARVEMTIMREVARRAGIGEVTPDWLAERLAATGDLRRWVETLIAKLETDSEGEVARALVEAYLRGGTAAAEELARAGRPELAVPAARTPAEVLRALPADHALHRLVRALELRVAGTNLRVVRASADVYRELVSAQAIPEVLSGVTTRYQASARAFREFLARGITGFTDVRGARWSMSGYVEMAARTSLAHASVEGHLDALASVGIDLVKVSDSPLNCARCAPWENKVLARGGTDYPRTIEADSVLRAHERVSVQVAGTVAQAVSAGLMHPNCTHSLSAFLPGTTRLVPAQDNVRARALADQLRATERAIRAGKRALEVARAFGNDAAVRAQTMRVSALQARARAIVTEGEPLGVFRQPYRESVDLGYQTAGR